MGNEQLAGVERLGEDANDEVDAISGESPNEEGTNSKGLPRRKGPVWSMYGCSEAEHK